MKLNKYIQKSCCFYASDWHLTVMLLPYINNKVQENCSIYMKCENNIEEKMNILLNKLTLKNKKNIMNINWGNLVAEDDVDDNEKIYIVSGSDKYIKNINNLIEQCYDKKNYNIKIINCYEVRDNEDLGKIISENGYTQILNTKGECDIKNTVL